MNRREFLAGTMALGFAGCRTSSSQGPGSGRRVLFGVCRGNPDEVAVMKEVGFDFWEGGVWSVFDPAKGDAWWREQKDRLAAYALPLRSCNGFIPGKYRIMGPKADHAPALDYAETVLRRADEIGVTSVVFGSGGARNVPGYMCGPAAERPDPERATEQFTEFCRALADRTRDLRKTVVAIEPLRPRESNIVNYVWQGQQIVRDIGSPRIRVLADIFHMMMGRESAESIERAGADLVHCHIASYGTRDYPGAQSESVSRFKPYFEALRRIGYSGGVSCECGWGDKKDFRQHLETALKTLRSLA